MTQRRHAFRINRLLACTALGASVALPTLANAQSVERIVVTAQKREESLQDVSVAVTAYTSQTLKDIGLANTNDLSALMPNVEIVAPFGNQQAQTHIRGAGSVDFNANSQTTIGFYVDEVYLPNTSQHTVQMFDLERVEVLRGPQGTLYGRNATAGAINLITAKPSDVFGGYATASYGNFDAVKLEGAVTGPITETLSGRLSAVFEDDDGWMTGRGDFPGSIPGDDFNDTEYYAYRGALAWTPTDALDVLLNVHGSADNSSGFHYQMAGTVDPDTFEITCDATVRTDCIDFFGYQDPDGVEEEGDPAEGDFDFHGPAEYNTSGGYVRADYALEGFTLTSISAYDAFDRFHNEDADSSPNLISHNFYSHETSGWSQELRATSTTTGPLDWIAGVYYAEDDLDSYNWYNFFGFITYQTFVQEQSSAAVYANLGYQLNDQFRLYGGLRYTEDEVELTHESELYDPPPPVGFDTGLSPFANDSAAPTYDAVTWKVGLDYTPTDDLLIYGHVSTGYKSGGVNVGFGDPGEFNVYDAEELLAYEAGVKSALFNGAALLNVSAFYYDYEDMQQFDQSTGAFGNLVSVIDNAPKAEAMGAEAELTTSPVEGLDLTFNLGYLSTEFTEFLRPLTGVDLAGNEFTFAPEWKASGIARYEWAAPAFLGETLAASVDWSWTDQVWHSVENLNDVRGKAHWLVGGRLSLAVTEQVEVALWGENLLDTEYRTQSFDFRNNGFITSVPNKPLTYGVAVGYTW